MESARKNASVERACKESAGKIRRAINSRLHRYIHATGQLGTPDSVKHALTDASYLIIGSARCAEQELILSCLFLIRFYLNVLLFL